MRELDCELAQERRNALNRSMGVAPTVNQANGSRHPSLQREHGRGRQLTLAMPRMRR